MDKKKEIQVEAEIHAIEEMEDQDLELDLDDTDGGGLGPRTRKMTAKGLEYTLQSKRKRLEQLARALDKSKTSIFDILDVDADEKQVQKLYKKWINLYDEFISVHTEYIKVLPQENIQAYEEDWYFPRNDDFQEFKDQIARWIIHQANVKEEEKEDKEEEIELLSNPSSHHSSISRRSSKISSVLSEKAQEEKRQAELKIKAQNLKKRKKLEQQKLKLKLKEEEIKLEEEMALSEARFNVLKGMKEPSSPKTSVAFSDSGSADSALKSIVRHLKKPSSDVKQFGGNPLDFHRFMRQFKTHVLANCDDFDEKLDYLEQYTTGDANKIVSGYSYLKPESGYKAAMKDLEDRYGDPDIIVNAFIKKALNWPIIKIDNPKALDEYAIFLAECEHAVQDLDAIKVLEYTENFQKIVGKLPYALHDKWRSKVQEKRDKGKRPSFNTLVSFVTREAKKLNDPMFGRDAMSAKDQAKRFSGSASTSRPRGSFATELVAVKDETVTPISKPPSPSDTPTQASNVKVSAFTAPCVYCQGTHTLEFCQLLPTLNYYDRTEFLKSQGYCFGCLRYGHQRKLCRNKAVCSHCKRRHPTILHVDGKLPPRPDNRRESATSNTANNTLASSAGLSEEYQHDQVECTMAIIPVKLRLSGNSKILTTYAFLDPGSNISFCTEKLKSQLGAEGRHRKLTMNTMGTTCSMNTYEVPNIEVLDLEEKNVVSLPVVYTKDKMPVSKSHIPTSEDIHKWTHFHDIELPQLDTDVGLLIGNNVPDAYAPLETRVGPRGSPHASRSLLGWIPWNVLREGRNNLCTVNRADVIAIEYAEELKDLNKLYSKSVNMDFPEKVIDDKKENSVQDQRFIQRMLESKTHKDGHYQFNLPFKEEPVKLPDNKFIAIQRLTSLRKKLERDPQLCEDYNKFMQMIIERHYAEEVSASELNRSDGKVWYLPHHGVYHAKKKKLRVVFDCSSKYHGVCLNDFLLQGPNLTTGLIGVLLRFRQEKTAIMGDIEKMFYQVMVPVEDRDCLRFYWWPNGNLRAEPSVYRMVVHLFGAASSPSCASYALHQTIQDNKDQFSQQTIELAMSSFYVDDFLSSVLDEDDAIVIIKDVTSLCEKGGFHITKWVTNSKKVFKSIPEEEQGTKLADIDLDTFPTDRALGVLWDMENDCLTFQITPPDCLPTRRSILSVVSSVYDPHGLVAPFVLIAKVLLQDLCRKGIDWDTVLSGNDLCKWQQWINNLPDLKDVKINRCFKSCDHKQPEQPYWIELHHFADASDQAYGTASYLKFVDEDGQIHCALVFGKSRVAPLKKMTTPRMELAAATLAVKMNKLLTTELTYPINRVYFWTDSMAVLRYIANECTRFHTFVANRLTVIREGSDIDQWHFIESGLNPADFATRGLQIKDTKFQVWLHGPSFLCTPDAECPQGSRGDMDFNLPVDDPEIKKIVNVTVTQKPHFLDELLSKYSTFIKLVRILAWILRYKACLLKWICNKDTGEKLKVTPRKGVKDRTLLTMELIQKAEETLISHAQRQYFSQEMDALLEETPGSKIKKQSSLYRLDPFMEGGMLRVGGRLSKACLSYVAKHQLLIPKESPLAKMILQHIHQVVGHQGKNTMLAKLREKYWIPQAGTLIKSITTRCVICRKYSAKPCMQKMSDLPKSRIVPDQAPFSHSGMDYFGPFSVKRGRATVKRYGVIFTCFTSRAVHLEVAHSLDTDSCINAIRRFKARRGQIKSIRSDNGTNLVGARNELKQNIDEWNHSKITQNLQQDGIEWHFNPPAGSHFGGVWERLIRSVRKVLYAILTEHPGCLDDESLNTVMCEVEYILNSRPITPVSEDVTDSDALSPNDLLLLRPDQGLPPGLFDSNDNYARRKWRQVQYFANIFWKRWLREYLPLLQERQKWLRPQRNLRVGDIVLLVENTTRGLWPLGRVLSVHCDDKGLVRVVTVKTATTTLQRPVDKLCLILEADLE